MPTTRISGAPRSAAALFDAAASPFGEAELHALGLEIVARPRAGTPEGVDSDQLYLRRAVGDGRLAVAFRTAGPVESRAALEARGIACEGAGEGLFVPVEGGVARRIAHADGTVTFDSVVLRARRQGLPPPAQDVAPASAVEPQVPPASQPRGVPAVPTEDEPTPAALLLAAAYALAARRRRLREEYLRSLLEPATGAPPLAAELARATAELERRLPGLPGGANASPARDTLLEELARGLLAAAERHFILDPQRSTLELLEPAARERFLGFAWHRYDFPGNQPGPNEARADELFAALTALRPERRANTGSHAVVRRSEFDQDMQRRVRAGLVAVPGETDHRLQAAAAAAYQQLRAAAAADGVSIAIRASYRSPERAEDNAAAAGNAAAVASFSAHTLGLAVDLRMSHGGLRYQEIATRPFQNLVDMYKSPVHKWMFLRGETHGWFPYRREPWHWEYNPPGYRERFRQAAPAAPVAPAPAVAESMGDAEVATDPVAPPLPKLTLTGSVGRGGGNRAADVRAVQQRLLALRELAAADATAEQPAGTGVVDEAALARTIAAIESFQTNLGLGVNGRVPKTGAALLELNRAIPRPSAAAYTAVATGRGAIGEVVSRGFTIGGAVGATATGNAPDDVRALQRRLVELGKLAAGHGETPAAGATAPVAQTALRATIAALRRFQGPVRFWRERGTIAGALTPGVVAPGDATAALLDRVSVYTMTSGGTTLSLQDFVAGGATRSERGVAFGGTSLPSAIPTADYVTLGLTASQSAALQFVSRHEGNFDAINTYDRAVVSVGFIQFAGGGRGLGPYLALLKARQPAKFRTLLQDLGIDIEFTASGTGDIQSPRLAVLDPGAGRVLRGDPAEAAIRDDKRLTTVLILSGRDRDVQLTQIEAAIRDYVLPSLAKTISWGGVTAPLREILRTEKGMAMLFDRSIQEGLGAARVRMERVVRAVHAARAAASLADLQAREAEVLARIESDLQAGADVSARITEARAALQALLRVAGAGGPAAATVAAVLATAELAAARSAVAAAQARLPDVVNVRATSGSTIDGTLTAIASTLGNETARLQLNPAPVTTVALVQSLSASREELAKAAGPMTNSATFLQRIKAIQLSTLN